MPSSVVAAINYDAAKKVLRVIYISGAVYEYKAVPQAIYNEMKNARSKGTYLNKFIKHKYRFEKLSD